MEEEHHSAACSTYLEAHLQLAQDQRRWMQSSGAVRDRSCAQAQLCCCHQRHLEEKTALAAALWSMTELQVHLRQLQQKLARNRAPHSE